MGTGTSDGATGTGAERAGRGAQRERRWLTLKSVNGFGADAVSVRSGHRSPLVVLFLLRAGLHGEWPRARPCPACLTAVLGITCVLSFSERNLGWE